MASAHDLYQRAVSQTYLTLVLGDKPQFQAPGWYFPAGGGVHTITDATFNHGWAGADAILKLARPIVVPVRQNIRVDLEFFAVGTGPTFVQGVNDPDDTIRVMMVVIDGLQTRDVQ